MVVHPGDRFGKLVAVRLSERDKHGNTMWVCLCDCGKEMITRQERLRGGRTKSCGCLRKERLRIHGDSESPEYESWRNMRDRCLNPAHTQWKNYGGRGITICPEWITDYETFLAYIGRRPTTKHSLDRIDNETGYQPNNVRWATRTEQALNKRTNRLVSAFGKTMSISEWAESSGISWTVLWRRLLSGMSLEDALSTPVLPRGSNARKLTPDQVIAIMARLLVGESQESIASFFNVTPTTISYIWLGKTWSHLFTAGQLQDEPS